VGASGPSGSGPRVIVSGTAARAGRSQGDAESRPSSFAPERGGFCNGKRRSGGSDRFLTRGLCTGGSGRTSASGGGFEQVSNSPLRHLLLVSRREVMTFDRSCVRDMNWLGAAPQRGGYSNPQGGSGLTQAGAGRSGLLARTRSSGARWRWPRGLEQPGGRCSIFVGVGLGPIRAGPLSEDFNPSWQQAGSVWRGFEPVYAPSGKGSPLGSGPGPTQRESPGPRLA
jgi:hypothetical protein